MQMVSNRCVCARDDVHFVQEHSSRYAILNAVCITADRMMSGKGPGEVEGHPRWDHPWPCGRSREACGCMTGICSWIGVV